MTRPRVRLLEHDWEPIPGLPGRLPPGETLLWQGKPAWWALAKRAFHVRKIAIYMALLLAWRVVAGVLEGEPAISIATSFVWLVPLALAGVGLPALLAWVYARSTIYTITSRRVVIRSGVAVPMAVNLPFAQIGNAALAVHKDGTGDLPLRMTGETRMSILQLWPNVRPWRLSRPEPMLRAVPEGRKVGALLAAALRGEVDEAAAAVRVVATPTSDPAEVRRAAAAAA